MTSHSSNSKPSALFVESCGSLISDGAGKPGGLDTDLGKPSLCIGDQPGCDFGTARFGRDVELIDFGSLQHVKPNGSTELACDSNIRKAFLQPLPKTLQCAESR